MIIEKDQKDNLERIHKSLTYCALNLRTNIANGDFDCIKVIAEQIQKELLNLGIDTYIYIK